MKIKLAALITAPLLIGQSAFAERMFSTVCWDEKTKQGYVVTAIVGHEICDSSGRRFTGTIGVLCRWDPKPKRCEGFFAVHFPAKFEGFETYKSIYDSEARKIGSTTEFK